MRQRIQTGLNPLVWAWATHLSEAGRRIRPKQPRTSPLRRGTRVAGCRQQLVHSWLSVHSRAEAWTHRQAIRPSLPARWLCACPWAGLMIVGGPWPHLQMWCRGSQQAPPASFFFLRVRAVLSSLRSAGESCRVEIASIKANSSCLSMMLRQELLFTTPDTRIPVRPAAVRAGTSEPVRTSLCALCP